MCVWNKMWNYNHESDAYLSGIIMEKLINSIPEYLVLLLLSWVKNYSSMIVWAHL